MTEPGRYQSPLNDRCLVCDRDFPQSYDRCPSENQPWHKERAEGRRQRCGHKHRCACGSNLSPLVHSDPEAYRRFGGCDRPCARCDSLDAQEAERGY